MTTLNSKNKNISQRGYNAERFARKILENDGFEIIYDSENLKLERDKKWEIEKPRWEVDDRIQELWDKEAKKLIDLRGSSGLSPKDYHKNKELVKAEREFYEIDAIHHKQLQQRREQFDKISGKLRKKRGTAQSILKDSGKFPEDSETDYGLSSVDYFCKKYGRCFIIDIKHQMNGNGKFQNQFYVTNNEIVNYRILKQGGKLEVKVLILLENDTELKYRIYDWGDFRIPKNFNPHKQVKTSIRLKDGLELDSFKII